MRDLAWPRRFGLNLDDVEKNAGLRRDGEDHRARNRFGGHDATVSLQAEALPVLYERRNFFKIPTRCIF